MSTEPTASPADAAPAPATPPRRRFRFGWFGDGGLGERLIEAMLAGRKTATAAPAYDPEDADVRAGDILQLVDKHGRERGLLAVTAVELRPFGSFDEELARAEGVTLPELKDKLCFANGRELRPDEEMRVVRFRAVTGPSAAPKEAP